jgi:peptide/nickel transport system ATP-binding protein
MLFITHDLAVVQQISDRVAVMYLGKIVEIASPEELYEHPLHHYSAMLLNAIPNPDPDIDRSHFVRVAPIGEVPSPIAPPSGCRFRTRCPRAEEKCAMEEPPLVPMGDRRYVACHFPIGMPPNETVPGPAVVASQSGAEQS